MTVNAEFGVHISSHRATNSCRDADKDMSQTIDKDEMKGVLITFSIDLSEDEISQVILRTHLPNQRGAAWTRKSSLETNAAAVEKA